MADTTTVGWKVCAELGCGGVPLAVGDRCVAHANEQDLLVELERLGNGGTLEARGVPINSQLLDRLLAAVPSSDGGRRVLKEPRFGGATFQGAAEFGRVTFQGPAEFGGATFKGTAEFGGAVFQETAWFAGATFQDMAVFAGVTFERAAEFGGATFQRARFDTATFQGRARFSGTTFNSWARFDGAIFQGAAGFDGAAFQGTTWFDQTTLKDQTWFDQATFKGIARFGGATFEGIVGFDQATFKGIARFGGATFQGRAGFVKATFGGTAGFAEATFQDRAGFDWAAFTGVARFRGTAFRKESVFGRATFKDEAEFDGVIFQGRAGFDGAIFQGRAGFDGAIFQDEAGFDGAGFQRAAGFAEATFQGRARFDTATFQDEAEFDRAHFQRWAGFDRATFQGVAGFIGATFEQGWRLGPMLVRNQLMLDQTVFKQRVRIEVGAATVCCRQAHFSAGVQLRLRWAKVVLDDTDLAAPSILTGVEPFRDLDEAGFARAWARLPPPRSERDRPRLLSARHANLAGLTISNVDLRACRFFGANNLDQLSIEGQPELARARGRPRTGRLTLAEEHHWRRTHRGWYPPVCQPPTWADPEPSGWPAPTHLAGLYRQLRKGREDGKDEPGAADFYYGEMEMRRHAAPWRSAERVLLTLYWLVSGYALRAWRAFATLLLVIVVAAGLFATVGFKPPETPRFVPVRVTEAGALVYEEQVVQPQSAWRQGAAALGYSAEVATSLLRGPERPVTAAGEWTQAVLRWLGPLLFGLALFSLRGRVKR